MAQTVEISLRIPSLRVQREEKAETISNSDVRFIKNVELDSIPKAGAVATAAGGWLPPCTLARDEPGS